MIRRRPEPSWRAERLPRLGGCGGWAHEGADRRRRLAAGAGSGRGRPGGSPSVLVVDDEASIRLVYGTNLRARGLYVLEAADGEEARAMGRRELRGLIRSE